MKDLFSVKGKTAVVTDGLALIRFMSGRKLRLIKAREKAFNRQSNHPQVLT